jgi:hypothetical protein
VRGRLGNWPFYLDGRYAHLTTISDFAYRAFGHFDRIFGSVVFVGMRFLSHEQKLEGWCVWRAGLRIVASHTHSCEHVLHVFTYAVVNESAAS